jgi:hypothetical protein
MTMTLRSKGQKLIEMYSSMATDGYDRTDGQHVENAFSDFELRPFRFDIQKILLDNNIQSILDYGSGGSDWELDGFDPDTNESAKDFFKLKTVFKYILLSDIIGIFFLSLSIFELKKITSL